MSERIMKVLANCGQGLSEEQKLQARTNIGAIGGVKVYDGSTTQELTPDAEGKVTVDLSEAGKVQSDWEETNSAEPSYIRNKPDLSRYATLEDLENMTGVFIGVYTGTEETTTPFADFYAAHLEGKALFLKREIDGTEYLFGADDISETTIRFTRTIGSVESNAYGTVKSYMAQIVKDNDDDIWNFYEKQLGDDQVQSDWTEADNTKKSFIRNKPNLATVATSGSYNDLTDKPSIPDPQVQSDWAEADNTKVDYIKNKPNLSTVATSGSYNDLSDKPTIPAAQVQSDWAEADNTKVDYIKNKPNLSTVATSGSYNDLSDKPSIPDPQVQSDWAEADNSKPDFIKNKPNLATVATSGSYNDLSDKPSIPVAQVQSDWTEDDDSDPSFILHKPNLATVATSGSYNDLEDKPTIPAAQVQSDWNQSDSSAVDYIKNKPAAMETKPLVAGTNIEFVAGQNDVTINGTSTKVVKRPAPYSIDTLVAQMAVYDPGEDFGALVRDQNDNTLGYLAPKHYGNADVGKVLTIVSDDGYKMEWRSPGGGSMELKPLTMATQPLTSSNPVTLTIADGYAYELDMQSSLSAVITLDTPSTDTIHSLIYIKNHGGNHCGYITLQWYDAALERHTLEIDMTETDYTYCLDVYIRKVTIGNTQYAIAAVHDYPVAYRNSLDSYSTSNETTQMVGVWL